MRVLRTIETDDTNGFQMGDKITVPYGGQDFTATCQVVKDGKALFFFDECIDRIQMNKTNTNKGGYAESYLKKWIDENVFTVLHEIFGERLQNVSIPTVEQLFCELLSYRDMEELDYEQLPLQKIRQNRICSDSNGDWEWYWLQNRCESDCFAGVTYFGDCDYPSASNPNGVRIAFELKNEVAE